LPHIQFSRHQIIWVLTGVLVSVIVIAGLALSMPAIERQLNRWQLLPQHEQLIELSLDDPEQLAKTYQPGQDQTVRFTVGNRTNNNANYTYTITETDVMGERTVQLAADTAIVAAGDLAATAKHITLADLDKRVYIRVQLSNGVSVGYWLQKQ
jgi:hypothetical protein